MHRIATAAVLGLFLAPSPASAAETAPSLTCEFKSGAAWSYDAGNFRSTTPAPLRFDIDSIDLDGQSATLEMGSGEKGGTLRVIRAINANHFLEVVNEGFLNLTTVYDKDPATGLHPAVHSRHFGILGSPVFSQYTGICREK